MPALQGEKVASRAQILKKAAEYIQFMRRKHSSHQQDIEDLKKQNTALEDQSNYLFLFIVTCGCVCLFGYECGYVCVTMSEISINSFTHLFFVIHAK